jgi:diguanylate cyclase (GGDEF)-like protein
VFRPSQSLAARAVAWVLPEGAILAAALVTLRLVAGPEPLATVAAFTAYAALGAGLFLGLRYRRARLLLALLVLALAERGLPSLPPPFAPGERLAIQAIGVLLPLNLAALLLLPERGLLTRAGLVRLGAILGQAALVAALVSAPPAQVVTALDLRLLPGALTAWTPLATPALAACALAVAACALGLTFESGHGGRTGLWTLAVVLLGFSTDLAGPGPTLCLAAAGLMLVAAVVESSFFLAYRDVLTGLPGRRALIEALERLAGHYTIAMVDVDHFKRINDRYGHDVGDQILRAVATRLAEVGNGGTAYRYGGEEFALVFPGKGLADVTPELERVRGAVADRGFRVRRLDRPRRKPATPRRRAPRAQLEVTVSIGAAEAGGRPRPEDVLRTADRALYRAKDGGRNRVET